jgi:hypothetical protein
MKRIFYLGLMILAFCHFGSAVSIGVSPGSFSIDNLLREGYGERTVRISTNSEEIVQGHFETRGELSEWISFQPNRTTFNMTSGQPYILKIIISPPNDAASGTYSGFIDFVTDTVGAQGSRAGSLVKAGVTLRFGATVTDEQIIDCTAGGFSVSDIEEGFPLILSYTILNKGNVRISPPVQFEILDWLQEKTISAQDLSSPVVLPTVEDRIEHDISIGAIPLGQYIARITIPQCGSSGISDFSIVEKGAIIDKGSLERIENKAWAYVNEPVEISAIFTNSGPRQVGATFLGSIKLDDRIVEVIETREVRVDPGETASLSEFFTPKEVGRYIITGRVAYNKKLTFEKGSVLNVNPADDEGTKPRYSLLLIYLIIVISIIFLIRKIRKERKKRF